MLDILLQILSVLGIVLLVLLGLLVVAVLLVLFFPVTYRVDGKRSPDELVLNAKANWLCGLLRVRYSYPEPGELTVKLLWFSLFKSEQKQEKPKDTSAKEHTAEEKNTERNSEPDRHEPESHKSDEYRKEHIQGAQKEGAKESSDDTSESKVTLISKKIEKLKYTISGIYDKIKKIWQNISYYAELLKEEETRLLFSHAKLRLWKILKSIRPRKLRADILFGTGSPDTTGYAFGVYAALSPTLGPYVAVTPDFERAVLQGEFEAAGHIMAAVLVWHFLRVILDKRLWRLLDKLKGKDTKSRHSGARRKRRNGGKNGR